VSVERSVDDAPAADAQFRQRLRDCLAEGLADDGAQALREQVAAEVPKHLADNGLRLWIHHYVSGDRAGMGFALVTETTAELAEGAARLYAADLFYPGAALVRQLLECGYLLALAGERKDEMADWIDGSADDLRKTFTPGRMRARSVRGFRFAEYQSHCERGGHPHREGALLLRHHDEARPLSLRSHWLDLAQHLAEIWEFFSAALPLYDPRLDAASGLYRPADAPEGRQAVSSLLDQWREQDPLAGRLDLPLAT